MRHPGRKIGEILQSLGYIVMGGETIYATADNLDIIGVLQRVQRKPHIMDGPDTFYGRRIALIRAHGIPIVVEHFRQEDAGKVKQIRLLLHENKLNVKSVFVEKTEAEIEVRFK